MSRAEGDSGEPLMKSSLIDEGETKEERVLAEGSLKDSTPMSTMD